MTSPWQVNIFTLFPEIFPGPLAHSITGRALKNNIWQLNTIQIRDFATDTYKTVDDTPFGGGAGMVMKPDVLNRALDSLPDADTAPIIYLSPRGCPLQQDMVKKWASLSKIHLICGRYEGIDERLLQKREILEVSIGDFVLSGGELGALALIDACVRLLPGVMGDDTSLHEESFENSLLEYPHYTKPQVWEGMKAPDILLSGHHAHIQEWRYRQAEKITRNRRPDLWAKYLRSKFNGKLG